MQRRRADIRHYLELTRRSPSGSSCPRRRRYSLSADYQTLIEASSPRPARPCATSRRHAHRQRVRWWSALALLRSLASSPAAAAATLRNRADAAGAATWRRPTRPAGAASSTRTTPTTPGGADVAPGADPSETEETPDDTRASAGSAALAAEPTSSPAGSDAKLAHATGLVDKLLAEGFNPIVFCRFIPTAEYVAEPPARPPSRKSVEVERVTGLLPPDEREPASAI